MTRRTRPSRRGIAGLALGGFAVALGAWVALGGGGRGGAGGGANALVVLNTGTTGLDSIVVEADPPGAHGLAGRHGYLAPQDSVRIGLAAVGGDASVRVWRGGRVVAEHVTYFGGRSVFEVRVGDAAEAGRYRRSR